MCVNLDLLNFRERLKMESISNLLSNILKKAFTDAGFVSENIGVQECSIKELGDYQCNDALAMAKQYKLNPMIIAEKVCENLNNAQNKEIISNCNVAKPGFINLTLDNKFLSAYIVDFFQNLDNFNLNNTKNIIVDYGGPNIAKPLHVGHLRSADIGESIKRIVKAVGNNTLADVHLGDWGLQMGMVITEVKKRQPNLPYFDDNFTGEYPTSSPVTIQDLATLYPEANLKAKSDEEYMAEAKQATLDLQNGKRGYVALCNHILSISKADLKRIYDSLNINFDLWLGESDSKDYCNKLIEEVKSNGYTRVSEGALVIDVAEEDDKIEVPPFILVKSDGAKLYSTTDFATIKQREVEYNADRIIYVVDNRQSMHFTQLFRAINKTKILTKPVQLDFAGFGTMNGKDGRPYKTRDGGVMQLSQLIQEVKSKAYEKVKEVKGNDSSYSEDEMRNISNTVAIAALKFADLCTFRTKDCLFDPDKFCSFDGKTGPYLLYTITRAKSILRKSNFNKISTINIDYCNKNIINLLLSYKNEVLKAYRELAPNYLCEYIFKLANEFNTFYSSCNIINEQNEDKKASWLAMTNYTLIIMEKVLYLLGINSLEKM